MAEIFYTIHAQRAMAEREVAPAEIGEIVRKPAVVYTAAKGSEREGTEVRQMGELAVVVRPLEDGNILVITVLWRRPDQWTSEQMREKR